jgi:aryl carrier-like protein
MPAQDTTYLLLQMMISQQQSMLYMMQLMLQMQLSRNPTAPFKFTFPKMPGKPDPQNMPPEKKAAMEKVMESYRSKKVDHPIEKPNVIGIQKAKVIKPEKSAEEVLEHVLSGLLPNGYSKEKDLFEQGLTSLDTVKMVTRCGEHGYRLSMQDIYMHSTFEGLIACMKPGE